ncbi:MAG: YdeI/OmpD-associated family protein [Puniceicoccales bacterium]|jgi:uncharacterized protein YdeI (YjbR/CyaY-like superfamily)|nr:YdeI/OmpD-associated family protein [Puniceicoccales bacterium]
MMNNSGEKSEPERKFLAPQSQEEWRRWLERNAIVERGIWLLFPYKSSGLPGISYVQALEEALCFGWIDGMVKRHDAHYLSHRFSQRAVGSSWSEVNKQHARLLIAAGKMTEVGQAVLPDLDPELYVPPEDIVSALRKDSVVWENFCAFPTYYRNIRVAAIDNWRAQPEKFHRALSYFIKKTRMNRRYGRFK